MAKRLEFEIQGTPAAFKFDVEGSFTPLIEPVYQENADPPQLAELRHVWEFRGCQIVSSDATQATLWDEWLAFVARFEDRASFPTHVRLVRDPDGAAVEEWKLDSDDGSSAAYEQLRVESISAGPEDLPSRVPPQAHFRTTIGVTIRVSAVRKFADSVTGIVSFDQQVIETYQSGLRRLSWVTRIKTKAGVDARTKAQSYAAIDITSLDATYTYQTGNQSGAGGVDVTALDADEQSSRVPTLVQAVSTVQQWGVSIGATSAGSAPDEVEVTRRTVITADEERLITTAFARGPNAEQFVLSQKPGGELQANEVETKDATNEATGFWVQSQPLSPSTPNAQRTLRIVVTGGRRAVRDIAIAGGYPPVIQRGAFTTLRCETRITVRKSGGMGTEAELKLPPLLPEPWVLVPASSEEGLPEIDGEPASDPTQNKWVRSARLVYVASEPPNESPRQFLSSRENTVESYHLSLADG